MNKLSYHLILVNSSLRVLTDQVDQLRECIEMHNTKPLLLPVQNKKRMDKPKLKKQSIQNSIYEKIKQSHKSISFVQIQEKTGFNRIQIANAIYKLKKRNMITAKKRGLYIASSRSIN